MSPIQQYALLPAFTYTGGYVTGKILKFDGHIFGLVNALSTIAECAFRDLVSSLTKAKKTSEQLKISLISHVIFSSIRIIVLRHFNVIAEKGTMILNFINIVLAIPIIAGIRYHQAQEK